MKMKRRSDLELNEASELAIRNAMLEIEKMGADVKLTEATILLEKARNIIADYIDDNKKSFNYGDKAINPYS